MLLRSVLHQLTAMALSGATREQMVERVKAALKTVTPPETGAMSYMMSKQQHLNDRDVHWHPHVMFYLPSSIDAATLGANVASAAVYGGATDVAGLGRMPVSIFFCPRRGLEVGRDGGDDDAALRTGPLRILLALNARTDLYPPRMGGPVRFICFALVASCASARSFGVDDASQAADAPATPDAKQFLDAREPAPIDAALPDAAKPDAKEFLDAAEPIDAPKPIDAAKLPPDACVPETTQLLLNAAFDATPTGSDWTQVPIANTVCDGSPCGPFPLITNDGATPNSPPDQAFLGGLTGEDVSPQQQHVRAISSYRGHRDPRGDDRASKCRAKVERPLPRRLHRGSASDPDRLRTTPQGTVELVDTDGTVIENVMSLSNVTAATMTKYTSFSHTFTTDVAGKTVRLFFTSTNDVINNTNFFF